MIWLIPPIAFVCEFLDSVVGGGFGTILTPILMLMGYTPIQIVPCILVSEILTGWGSGLLHHKEGNVDFKDGAIQRLTAALALCAIVGTISAVIFSFKLPKPLVNQYIGWLVTLLGIGILIKGTKQIMFNKVRIMIVGLIASFNKGISGGGYGPLVMAGSMLSGVKAKNAVAVTGMAEGFVCAVGLITYCVMKKDISFALLPWILIGSLTSLTYCAKLVKKTPDKVLVYAVGIITLTLGLATLWKISNP